MSKVRMTRPPWRGHGFQRVLLVAVLVSTVGAMAGFAWVRYADRQHVATATIMLHPLEGNAYSPGGRGDDLVNLETEAQVLRSDAVARAVLERLGEAGEPSGLLSGVTVVVPPNTQLLEVSVRAADAATAVRRASAFAEVYLEFRRSRTESAAFGRTSRLDELVELREEERKSALARLDRLSSSAPERRLLEQQVQEIVVQIGSLRTQLATAQAISLDPGQVVTPGHAVDRGATASPVVMSGVGALAGLFLCLLVATVRSGRAAGTLIGDAEDLAGHGVVPLGGVVAPVLVGDDVIARARSAVLAVGPDRPLVVTVAPLSGGQSVTFAALVESLARARYEVVAIDLGCAPDRAALAELVLQQAVISDVLVESAEFRSRLRPLDDEEDAAGFVDLMASAQLRSILADLGKRADVVLVGAPALNTTVGRSVLAATRTVVVEVQSGVSTHAEIADLQAEVTRSSTHLAGAVLVDAGSGQASTGTGRA